MNTETTNADENSKLSAQKSASALELPVQNLEPDSMPKITRKKSKSQ